MANFEIGLSGMDVARRAIEIIGTNIAKVSTEGYHRQDPRIQARETTLFGKYSIGGAEIVSVRRSVDALLETEILRQLPEQGQASQELMALRTVESALGDMAGEGLMEVINAFFGSLQELAVQPDSQALRQQVVWAADAMASQFRNLGQFFEDLQHQTRLEAEGYISEVNQHATNIAQFNTDIEIMNTRGASANLLVDRRDQAVKALAELVHVQTEQTSEELEVTDVVAWGTQLVRKGHASHLAVATTEGGQLGVSVAGADYYLTDLSGGRIGGLLNLANNLIPDLRDQLDALAQSIIHGINSLHVQGVGTAGSFTRLTGWAVGDEALSEWAQWSDTLSAGEFYVRVTDLDTGTVTRTAIDVAGTDTLATLAAKLDAVTGINASVADMALRAEAADSQRYRFDFLPVADLTLQAGWSGTTSPSVSGSYTGQDNEVFTATVTAGGTVGLTDGLAVQITNADGEVVTTLRPGAGYPAGDRMEIDAGLYVAFSPGTLTEGQTFAVQSLAHSDSSGFLAAAGINTFFRGDSAQTITLCQDILADARRLATAAGEDLNDNLNVRRMADLAETPLASLAGMSPPDSYRSLVTTVAQKVNFTEARQNSLENVLGQLYAQRDEMSGVDINEEAGKLLIFERMFQAMAKFITVQDATIQHLMDLI